MRYAVSWSGGKDSMLALDRARRQGLDIDCLFNIFEGTSGRVRFHGVRKELIEAQAEALAIHLLAYHTHPEDYETVFRRVMSDLHERGVEGIIFGNIHLADIRAWYEERTVSCGFHHLEPLWGESPSALIREAAGRGYQARLVSIDPSRSRPEWLGATLDLPLIESFESAGSIDVCGERGEYHTFVSDGPLLIHPVAYRLGETVTMEGHRFIDLVPG